MKSWNADVKMQSGKRTRPGLLSFISWMVLLISVTSTQPIFAADESKFYYNGKELVTTLSESELSDGVKLIQGTKYKEFVEKFSKNPYGFALVLRKVKTVADDDSGKIVNGISRVESKSFGDNGKGVHQELAFKKLMEEILANGPFDKDEALKDLFKIATIHDGLDLKNHSEDPSKSKIAEIVKEVLSANNQLGSNAKPATHGSSEISDKDVEAITRPICNALEESARVRAEEARAFKEEQKKRDELFAKHEEKVNALLTQNELRKRLAEEPSTKEKSISDILMPQLLEQFKQKEEPVALAKPEGSSAPAAAAPVAPRKSEPEPALPPIAKNDEKEPVTPPVVEPRTVTANTSVLTNPLANTKPLRQVDDAQEQLGINQTATTAVSSLMSALQYVGNSPVLLSNVFTRATSLLAELTGNLATTQGKEKELDRVGKARDRLYSKLEKDLRNGFKPQQKAEEKRLKNEIDTAQADIDRANRQYEMAKATRPVNEDDMAAAKSQLTAAMQTKANAEREDKKFQTNLVELLGQMEPDAENIKEDADEAFKAKNELKGSEATLNSAIESTRNVINQILSSMSGSVAQSAGAGGTNLLNTLADLNANGGGLANRARTGLAGAQGATVRGPLTGGSPVSSGNAPQTF